MFNKCEIREIEKDFAHTFTHFQKELQVLVNDLHDYNFV